jgi:hypothetical protein
VTREKIAVKASHTGTCRGWTREAMYLATLAPMG